MEVWFSFNWSLKGFFPVSFEEAVRIKLAKFRQKLKEIRRKCWTVEKLG